MKKLLILAASCVTIVFVILLVLDYTSVQTFHFIVFLVLGSATIFAWFLVFALSVMEALHPEDDGPPGA